MNTFEKHALIPMIALAFSGAIAGTAWAEKHAKDGKSAVTAPEKGAKAGDEGSPETTRENERRREAQGEHLVGQLDKLREEMHDKLRLNAEQQKKINTLFEEHVQSLRKRNKSEEGNAADNQEAEAKALRERIREARASGDTETAEKLIEEMRTKRTGMQQAQNEETKQFIDSLKNELNDDQKEKFQEMASRLRLDGGMRRGVGDVGRIMRAVEDPKVKATDDQKRKMRQIVSESFPRRGREAGERPKWEPKKQEEEMQRVREAMLKELTDEQRKTVEEILAQPETRGEGERGRGAMRRGERPEKPTKENDDD